MKSRYAYEQKAQALATHIRRKSPLDAYLIVSDVLFDPAVDERHIAHITRKR